MLDTATWTIEGGRFLPQAYIDMSLHINSIYNNIEIGMLRKEEHLGENNTHPFCIMLVNSNGSVEPVKYLKEEEMNLEYILGWLKKNGTVDKTPEQHFKEYLDQMVKDEEAKKKVAAEKTGEEADLLATIASSPLHTFRHNGNKIGSDNNVPTLKKRDKEWL